VARKIATTCLILIVLVSVCGFATGAPEPGKEKAAAAVGTTKPQYGGTFTMMGAAQEPASPDIKDANQPALDWLEPIQERPIHGDAEKYGPRGNSEYAFQLVAYIPAKYQKGHLISKWEITREKMVWEVRPGVIGRP